MLVQPVKNLYLIVLVLTCAKSLLTEKQKKIAFETFCISGESPEPITSNGEQSAGILSMQDVKKQLAYHPGLNCSVTLSATEGHQLFLAFSLISLRNSSLDSLTVMYNSSKNISPLLSGQQVCSNENCSALLFESGRGFPNLTLNFISANSSIPKNATGFLGVFTVFDYADSQDECHGENQFACRNKHCIWNGLVCDGHNNCGDRSDELACDVSVKDTIWGIVVIAIGIVSLIIAVPVFCYLAWYGTRSSVKSLTLPIQPTPMYPTLNDGETTNLLTSSEVAPMNDSEETYGDFKQPMNYGTDSSRPSTSRSRRSLGSFLSEAVPNETFS